MAYEVDKGNEAFFRGEFEEAIKHYSEAIKLAPNDHELYSNRSRLYALLQNFEQAVEDAKNTVELKPDGWIGYCRLGEAYLGLRKNEEAIHAYKKGLELDPKNIAMKQNLGCAARQAGKFDEAIQHESDAIKLAPNDHELYSNRSMSYASLKNFEQALEDAKRSVELKPDWSIGYSGLGDAYLGLRKNEEAIHAYKKGLELDPKNIAMKQNLGCAARQAGKFDEAIQHESDAIKLAPNNHELYSNRSISYASLKNFEQALEDAKRSVELKPDWSIGYSGLGDAYLDLGKNEEAVHAYKKGLELDPKNKKLKQNLGCAATRAGKFDEAIQHFSDAIKLAPNDHELYSNRSLSYAELENFEQALEDAKRSVKLKPDWWLGYGRLGIAYLGLGKTEEAIHAYKKGLECDPGNKILESHLVEAQASGIISLGHAVWRIFRGASNQSNEGDKIFCSTSSDSAFTDFKVTKEELNGVRVATKLNDYIYELYKPTEKPDMDIILVHGLQLDGTDNLHLSTWISGDVGMRYHAWPKTWLPQDFPHARVLTVAYDSHLYQTAKQGRIDLHNTAEALMHSLLLLEEEETPSCRPVILVGYSFGGILIKQLCLHAFQKIISYHGLQLESFLNRIRAIYFMGTPHLGMIHEGFGLAVQKNASPLFKDVELLNETLARLHEDFDSLKKRCAWQVSSIGESNETRWGTLQTILVPEASARYGESFLTVQADHLSLSKPAAKTSLAYIQLKSLIKQASKSRRFNWNLTSNLSLRQGHEDGEEADE